MFDLSALVDEFLEYLEVVLRLRSGRFQGKIANLGNLTIWI